MRLSPRGNDSVVKRPTPHKTHDFLELPKPYSVCTHETRWLDLAVDVAMPGTPLRLNPTTLDPKSHRSLCKRYQAAVLGGNGLSVCRSPEDRPPSQTMPQ